MNALREGLAGENTRYIGPPEGDFFRFFGDQSGRDGTPQRRGPAR